MELYEKRDEEIKKKAILKENRGQKKKGKPPVNGEYFVMELQLVVT